MYSDDDKIVWRTEDWRKIPILFDCLPSVVPNGNTFHWSPLPFGVDLSWMFEKEDKDVSKPK